jgi:hypothetical protein
VFRNRMSGLEFAQHDNSAGIGIFMQRHQLDAIVGAGLPGSVSM